MKTTKKRIDVKHPYPHTCRWIKDNRFFLNYCTIKKSDHRVNPYNVSCFFLYVVCCLIFGVSL